MKCPVPLPQEMVQEIVSDDDQEEETLQSDAEIAKKVTVNETYTLLSILTTGKAHRFIQDAHAPLHDESVIAVRDKFLDVSDEMGQRDSRSMTIKATNTIMTKRMLISRVASEIVFSAYALRHGRSVARGACDASSREADLTS